MFTPGTAFILGAGASWHYGYPTGERLVSLVVEKATIFGNFCRDSMGGSNVHRPDYIKRNSVPKASMGDIKRQWEAAWKECEALSERLKRVNPLVIDYFLGQNPELQPIGKLLIAWIILEAEAMGAALGNVNRFEHERNGAKDDWCRFIVHKMASGCSKSEDIHRNDVTFVTFNYDVSLDDHLHRRLSMIEMFAQEDVDRFLKNRIIHVYGSVREYPDSAYQMIDPYIFDGRSKNWHKYSSDRNEHNIDIKNLLDVIYPASLRLLTIDPHEKANNRAEIEAAQKAIVNARRLYILGYGFDDENSKRLNLPGTLRIGATNSRFIMFTNYTDSNRINKRAGKIFLNNYSSLLSGQQSLVGSPDIGYLCEKSTRDVYGALELDFETLDN